MIMAQIVSWWVVNNNGIHIDITKFNLKMFDVTEEKVSVLSPVVVECNMLESVYNEILNDVDYGEGSVMWSESYE